MAARRLVMILLVLLVVSTFAATLVPTPQDESDETSTSTTSTGSSASTTAAEPVRGEIVQSTVSAEAKRPEAVPLRLGDGLELRVTSEAFREVEIPSLGESDEVDRFQPAIFDLLPERTGTFAVREVEGEVIARIEVRRDAPRDPKTG